MCENYELYSVDFDVGTIFELEDGMIVIEKDIWFEEFLIVHTLKDALEKLNPVNRGWTFKEPYRGVFRRGIYSLAKEE
jgi:hypothetical protein